MGLLNAIYNRLRFSKPNIRFKRLGEGAWVSPDLFYSNEGNISIGVHTNVGPHCVFYATLAEISLGNYVMISPKVSIITGEHRTDIIGEYMKNIGADQKITKNDKPVVIEDDVWIGTGCIILKGVTIGRGSIVHAGMTISKNIAPYTIYINNDLQISRFSPDQIIEHERELYRKYKVSYSPLDLTRYKNFRQ